VTTVFELYVLLCLCACCRNIVNENVVLSLSGLIGTSKQWPPTSNAPSVQVPSTWLKTPPNPISMAIGQQSIDSALWSATTLS
jgi:hypothetical protein